MRSATTFSLASILLLSACVTHYEDLNPRYVRGSYQLRDGTCHVEYFGDRGEAKEIIEEHCLLRSAYLTLALKRQYFKVIERKKETRREKLDYINDFLRIDEGGYSRNPIEYTLYKEKPGMILIIQCLDEIPPEDDGAEIHSAKPIYDELAERYGAYY